MKDLEIIYKALRGKATEREENRLAQWHKENPTEFQRYADKVHMQIDMMELYGDELKPKSRIATYWKKAAIIGLQAAAVLAIGVFVGGYVSEKRTYDMISEQVVTVDVPFGQRMQLTLPDGSSVQLNAGAKLEYPVVFRRDCRKVKLSGEALFTVEAEKQRPFIVETYASDIRVLGTKFDVEADEAHRRFTTALLEGRIQLSNKLNPTQPDIIMKPNDIATLSNGHLWIEPLDDSDVLCWTDGLISISGLAFDELMRKFERAFDVEIVISRKPLPDIENVSGKIRVNDGIEKALRILRYTADFSFEIDPETNVVTIY